MGLGQGESLVLSCRDGRGFPTHLPQGAVALSTPSLHLDSAWRLWLQNKRYLLLLATND